MNELMLFQKEEFGQVRVVERNGEPWFVAKDVCECLELTNASQTLSYLDDDERDIISNDTPGGKQNMLIVSEPGLYVHIKQEVLENDKVVYHRRWTQLGREWLIGRFGIKAA